MDRPGNLSRFAHLAFAGFASTNGAAEIEAEAVAQHVPGLRQSVTSAEMRRQIARHPGYATAADAAAATVATMRKLQGKNPPTAPAASVRGDLNTAEGLAAHAVASARRAGVVR